MNDGILVKSVIDENNNAKVLIAYELKKLELILTGEDACKHGIALFKAALVSEYEANLLYNLSPLYNQTGKGFGQKAKNEQIHASFLKMLRDCRPELPDFVKPIFGYKTQAPLVDYFLSGHKIQLGIEECLYHAGNVLQCAEAATTDEFLLNFLTKANVKRNDALGLLQEYSTFRKATWLESLL